MVIFFVFAVLAVALARKEECGEHEHYHTCGTPCPLTCENYLDHDEDCPLPCVPGCHCDPGYVKARTGKCVEPEKCPRKNNFAEKNCFEKPEVGSCTDSIPRFYYDPSSEECHKFFYGGCEGNGNHYMSYQECMESCSEDHPEVDCKANKDPGQCYTNMPRYYYDRETEECELFIYKGCGGNSNNFVTKEECYYACGWGRQR